jgi:hypothetical protein
MHNINSKPEKTQNLNIYEAITYYYNDLMKIAEREYIKLFHTTDNDSYKDIAHDTIIRMCDIYANVTNLTKNHVLSYYCKAVRTNYIRDLMYAYNKDRDNDDFDESIYKINESNEDSKIDYSIIIYEIEKRFGKDSLEQFSQFIKGYTLREINQQWNINNADYIVRKIRDFIKENFNGYSLNRRKNKKIVKKQ